jgi:SEC-C motif-containing protein
MTAPNGARPGRNQPCHCGSGRKYKHCCLEKDAQAGHRSFLSFSLVVMLVVLGVALLLPYVGMFFSIWFPNFGTRVFFLLWAVFPWGAVYPASALESSSPMGSPVGGWANLLQWVVVTMAFSAVTRRLTGWPVILLAIATVVIVASIVDSILLPMMGMRFYLVGP